MVLETFLSDLITSPETPRRTRRLVRLNCVVEPINTLIFNIDKVAINQLNPGDAVVIFTPDGKCPVHAHKFTVRRASFLKGTHYVIARYAIERGLHVLVTKPATQLLSHHLDLIDLSRKHNVVCFVEHHKRFVFFLYTGLSYAWAVVVLYSLPDMTLSIATPEPVRDHLVSSTFSTLG